MHHEYSFDSPRGRLKVSGNEHPLPPSLPRGFQTFNRFRERCSTEHPGFRNTQCSWEAKIWGGAALLLLRNGPSGGGTRDLLKASYSLSRIWERTRKCVFHIVGCVITIGYVYRSCSAQLARELNQQSSTAQQNAQFLTIAHRVALSESI